MRSSAIAALRRWGLSAHQAQGVLHTRQGTVCSPSFWEDRYAASTADGEWFLSAEDAAESAAGALTTHMRERHALQRVGVLNLGCGISRFGHELANAEVGVRCEIVNLHRSKQALQLRLFRCTVLSPRKTLFVCDQLLSHR